VVVHIVLFNPKLGLTADQLRSFAQSIQDATRTIGTVRRALVGKAVQVVPSYPRSLGDQTYEFAAVLEFDDAAALEAYLEHPSHRVLGRLFWDNCASAIVMEAELRDALTEDLVSALDLKPAP
jgi:hypothetical protein